MSLAVCKAIFNRLKSIKREQDRITGERRILKREIHMLGWAKAMAVHNGDPIFWPAQKPSNKSELAQYAQHMAIANHRHTIASSQKLLKEMMHINTKNDTES